jgi:excisionase family DNA binding protein
MTRSRYRWEANDLLIIEEMIEQGQTDAEIGRRLGATATAVNIVRKRRGIAPRRKAILTARVVAARLGLGCSKTVAWWIRAGYLKGRRGQRCGLNRMWYITEEALLDFLQDARYWHLWEPERLESGLRLWASEIRNGTRFLTTGEVAARFFVEHATVNDWIHKGYLPAVRRDNWLIKESDLVGFVPPCDRPRGKVQRREALKP